MPARTLFEGELFADYFQLYLCDVNERALPDDYAPEAIAQRLTASAHAVVIHTERNMTVPIRVEWHDERPEIDETAFQHVVEAGLDAPSGGLVLAGLSDDFETAPRLSVPAGAIGVVAAFAGLDTLSEDALDGDDRYALHLWGGPVDGVHVLRQYGPRITEADGG